MYISFIILQKSTKNLPLLKVKITAGKTRRAKYIKNFIFEINYLVLLNNNVFKTITSLLKLYW